MSEFYEKIKSVSNEALASNAVEKFERYYALLLEWNERFNLTAITDRRDVFVKHFLDSISAAPLIPQNASVLDIGAGAGFPSLPLKIARDDLSVTCVDSVNKKVAFLGAVIDELGLKNARAIHSRAEDLPKTGYDAVVSRAVASLNVLCEYCLPFVRIGGALIAYKSEKTDEELAAATNAIKILGGKVKELRDVSDFVGGETTRKLIVIEKIAPSPPKYPRGKNLPRLKPL